MKHEEGVFKKKFCEYAQTFGAWAHHTHGNQYSAGLPDTLIAANKKLHTFTEFKFWGNVNAPKDAHAIQALLKGPQVNVIKHQLWKRDQACLIIAVIGNDLDNCAVCYQDKFNIIPWKHVAKVLAISTEFDTVLNHVFPH